MLLAIDVGNTNSVFALHDGEIFIAQWRCETQTGRTADEYFVWLSQLFRFEGIKADVEQVIISSTVPRVVFNLRVLADHYFNTRPLVVGRADCALPIAPRVDAGVTVGADRLCNALAGSERYGGDLIIVDFGTATTFDVVDCDGAYIGGAIAPGVNLSLQALHNGAAALPHIDITEPESVIGTNTLACMQSGVYWGYLGLLEGLCKRIKAQHPRKMKVIATGGLAPLFERNTDVIDDIDLSLTLNGLYLIAKYNQD